MESNNPIKGKKSIFPSCDTWREHWKNDILPYWFNENALGNPEGNFPTTKDQSGKESETNRDRYTRILARQIYTYFIGFQLTGNIELFLAARNGLKWLNAKAVDKKGGFFSKLDYKGFPILDDKDEDAKRKTSQDLAYITSAYAIDYYISRDHKSKEMVENTIDLIFNGPFWDKERGVIIDALTNDMSEPIDFENPGSDLVSYLDQLNAYLLLFLNQSEDPKNELLYKCRQILDLIIYYFYSDNMFWNTDINRTNFRQSHVDTGHVLKTYWMFHRFNMFLMNKYKYNVHQEILKDIKELVTVASGFGNDSFWNTHFTKNYGMIKENPDWWVQIEMNQLCADLSLIDKSYVDILNKKATCWLTSNFIDRSRAVRGIKNGIRWDGKLYDGDEESWTSKANKWKNGYHETEHCLVLDICSHSLLEQPLVLYFALPQSMAPIKLNINPYIFSGEIVSVDFKEDIPGSDLVKTAVTFNNIT